MINIEPYKLLKHCEIVINHIRNNEQSMPSGPSFVQRIIRKSYNYSADVFKHLNYIAVRMDDHSRIPYFKKWIREIRKEGVTFHEFIHGFETRYTYQELKAMELTWSQRD